MHNAAHRQLVLIVVLAAHLCLLVSCNRKPKLDSSNEQNGSSTSVVDAQQNAPTHERAGYVGSQSCAECHEEISAQYAKHSMGRSAISLAGNATKNATKNASNEATNEAATQLIQQLENHVGSAKFEADGYRYEVRKEGDDWIHHQGRIASDGTEIAAVDFVAKHLIGSGNHGQSFLVERSGHLFMSPITWYPDKQIWDLSPGYERNNSQFNRPVIEQCVYCHTDVASAVPSTLNRYKTPAIHAHAIGCERCHGPGEEHVSLHQAGSSASGKADSIVNPTKLTPDLREAVCQQCHLSGGARITKSGKSLYDFRPGEPLESAYTIFNAESLAEEKSDKPQEFVGHVEQMHASRCFTESDGRMGCISCHDPHRLPNATERISFYRDRCLTCHTNESCAEDASTRTAVTAEDSCVHCHMPARETEIRHAAVTDHSIPRQKKSEASRVSQPSPGRSNQVVAFPSNEKAKPTPRDSAIAMVQIGSKDPDLFSGRQLDAAQRALELAVKKDAKDIEALEALAELYLAGNDFTSAMRVCQQVLSQVPNREQTLVIIADTYSGTGNFSHSIPYWKRAIQVNGWMSKYWYKLGEAYAETQQWGLCLELANKGKARFPTSVGLRHLLLRSSLALGDPKTAATEFAELERFAPKGIESIRDWYRTQTGTK